MFYSYQIFQLLFLLLPIAVVSFFAVSLVRYCIARSKNKKSPDFYSAKEMHKRMLMLVFSSIILGIIVFSVLCVLCLLMFALSFM